MKPIEGESAFPHGPLEVYDEARHRWNSVDARRGLSERRYYIGQALAGYCASHQYCGVEYEQLAKIAIAQADAVMKQLYPQPKETNQ